METKQVFPDCALMYKVYDKKFPYWTSHPENSFRSLLSANEAYLENPYGKKMPWVYDDNAGTDREHLASQWQTAQSKVNNKYVILQKI